jgi:hypothetical protein
MPAKVTRTPSQLFLIGGDVFLDILSFLTTEESLVICYTCKTFYDVDINPSNTLGRFLGSTDHLVMTRLGLLPEIIPLMMPAVYVFRIISQWLSRKAGGFLLQLTQPPIEQLPGPLKIPMLKRCNPQFSDLLGIFWKRVSYEPSEYYTLFQRNESIESPERCKSLCNKYAGGMIPIFKYSFCGLRTLTHSIWYSEETKKFRAIMYHGPQNYHCYNINIKII